MAVVNRNQYNSMKSKANQSAGRRRVADDEVRREKDQLDQIVKEGKSMTADDLRAMQRQFERANRSIQSELEAIREEFGHQLGRQAAETRRSLEEIRRLAESNQRELGDISKKISSLEDRMNQDFQKWIESVNARKKQAMCYYDRLTDVMQQIELLYPEKYEVFFPDTLQPGCYTLRSSLGYVMDNMQHENYEAAIGVAQTRLPEAVSMLGHLEAYHCHYLRLSREIGQELEKLKGYTERMELGYERVVSVSNGTEYTDEHGADYWVRELYEEVKSNLQVCKEEYDECLDTHDADAMEEISEKLTAVGEQLSSCEIIAQNERRLHYECCERASQIYELIDANDQGIWQLEEIRTEEEELRNPVYISLVSPEEYHLVIACIPERNPNPRMPGTVRCELETYDGGMEKDDKSRCDILYRNIREILQSGGIRLSSLGETNSFSDTNTFFDHAGREAGQARNTWVESAKQTVGLIDPMEEP